MMYSHRFSTALRAVFLLIVFVGLLSPDLYCAEKSISLDPFKKRLNDTLSASSHLSEIVSAQQAFSKNTPSSKGVKYEFMKGAAHAAGALAVTLGVGALIGYFRSFSKAIPLVAKSPITLKDYIGAVPAYIQAFLHRYKHPERYKTNFPKGYLFWGPSGSGKTYLAQGIANELDCPFFSRSGTDFLQMFLGQSEGEIRNIFNEAQAAAKQSSSKIAIIFIDEIDAIAKKRTGGSGFYGGVTDNIVNALLAVMDGLDEKGRTREDGQVIVIGATNFAPHMLDPALMREGRFGVHIEFEKPAPAVLEQMLDYQIKKFNFAFEPEALAHLKKSFDIDNPAQVVGVLRAIEDEHVGSPAWSPSSLITQDDVQRGLDHYTHARNRAGELFDERGLSSPF